MIAGQEPPRHCVIECRYCMKVRRLAGSPVVGAGGAGEGTTPNHSLHRLRLRSRYQSRRQIARRVVNFELYHHLAFRLIIEIAAAIADGFPDDDYVMTRCPVALIDDHAWPTRHVTIFDCKPVPFGMVTAFERRSWCCPTRGDAQ